MCVECLLLFGSWRLQYSIQIRQENFETLLSYASSINLPFSLNTLWSLGIVKDEGIDGAPNFPDFSESIKYKSKSFL